MLHSPGPTWLCAGPFFLDLRIILPSSATLRRFRIKQDVRGAAARRVTLGILGVLCYRLAFNNPELRWNGRTVESQIVAAIIFNNLFVTNSLLLSNRIRTVVAFIDKFAFFGE